MDTLFKIEPVSMLVYFDAAPPADCASISTQHSPEVLELLHRANLLRGTVVSLTIGSVMVAPAGLARLNWYLHVHGYTRGFRGWKRRGQKGHGGMTLWKSAAAWAELCESLNLTPAAA